MTKKRKSLAKGTTSAAPTPEGVDVASKPSVPVEANTSPDLGAETQPESGFPIVGIGASAGGLAAFEAFFSAMPTDSEVGMAFVLVQHLAPDHKSILSDLVKRYTRMKVIEVEDGMEVCPNCAYIIPPNRDMAFLHGRLHLLEPTAPRGLRLPIDFFFRSLAQDQRERAICIVLSGTGSDGTLGVRAVKGEGGVAMVQDPNSTDFDGMPRSAIATGLVDYVLPPAEMPAQLVAYANFAFGRKPRPVSVPCPRAEGTVRKVCLLLRSQTGHDFSQYKQNTIVRRVERRMALHQIDRSDEYLRYLQKNPAETEALFRDLLINVTNFFRDPDAFAALASEAIPRLFANKAAGETVRVWVCGCSTGEEAYSIAILIREHVETLKQAFKVQIFATDVDKQAIDQARTGVFPPSIAADVSSERLARFFIPISEGGAYRVQKDIRDMLVFSEQDMIKDPPFSKLDMVSCRNLLIYLGGELQRRLVPLFYYALNPGGVLFLGTSESIGDNVALFRPLCGKWKIYTRRDDSPSAPRAVVGTLMAPPVLEPPAHSRPTHTEQQWSLRELTQKAILDHYVQAALLINARGEILHICGRTGKYLEPAPGDAAMNVLHMAREGLRRPLATAIHKVVASKEPVFCSGLRVKANGDTITASLAVRPVAADHGRAGASDILLIVLEETPLTGADLSGQPATGPEAASVTEADKRIAVLEQELRAKEEYLQTTLEEMETSNEELKSTNEEMQSVNEELQSTNEELETSKEELQSVNEELATVNAELQTKVADLSQNNNDMNNLLAGTGVGTLFVDLQLRISRFTPAATQVINLIQTDVGRPVAHVVSNLVGYDRLVEDAQAVLDDLIPREVEVQTKAGTWFLMRIRPYRTLTNVIEGVVLTFVDITEHKRDRNRLAYLASFPEQNPNPITEIGFGGDVRYMNPAAQRLLPTLNEQALSHPWLKDWDASLRSFREGPANTERLEVSFAGRAFEQTRYYVPGQEIVRIYAVDITDRRRFELDLAESKAMAENIVATVREPLLVLDGDLRVIMANRAFYSTFRAEPDMTVGRLLYDLGNRQWNIPALRRLLEEILPENSPFEDFEVTHEFEQLGRRTMRLNARRVERGQNELPLILLAIEDVSKRGP